MTDRIADHVQKITMDSFRSMARLHYAKQIVRKHTAALAQIEFDNGMAKGKCSHGCCVRPAILKPASAA